MKSEKNDIIQMLSQSFYTKTEFNNLLLDYINQHGLEGIFFDVKKSHEKISHPCSYVYGTKVRGQSAKTQKAISVVDGSITINCSIWSQQNVSSEIEDEVLNIIKKYLNTEIIYRSTLLPSYEHQHEDEWLDRKLESTIKRFIDAGKSVAVFMMDLDHFKDVNDQNDHSIGGSVLFEFSNLITLCCEEKAVIIHRSGDEFFVIMPYTNLVDPLELAYSIREKVKCHSYQNVSQRIDLTAAQGIYLITDDKTSFKDAVFHAEKAYKPDGQDKYRDSVRMACLPGTAPQRVPSDRDLAYAVVRSHLADRSIFFNPYLDFISFMMSECGKTEDILVKDLQAKIEQWVSWFDPAEASGMQFLSLKEDINFACDWSYEELAFALFHGLCRNPISRGKNINLSFNPNQGASFIISLDSEPIYSYGDAFDLVEGQGYEITLPNYSIEECAVRNIVLIHIGYEPLIIPDCFFRVIRIDARPFTGGYLPDFWAGALSELIDLVSEKSFINQVVVYGNRENAKKLCGILDDIEHWSDGNCLLSIAKQTKQLPMSIEKCKERLKGHILFVNERDKDSLIQWLKQIYSESPLEENFLSQDESDAQVFLDRNLSYEPIRLKIEDGCTVNTMEEAFPTVLEIIRKYGLDEIMTDQAGRELKELTNFKLTITNPSSKSIPEYYSDQESDLIEYYQSVLGKSDGFFQTHLEENGQYQAVLQHIISLIDGSKLKYATRRALLVIPHKVKDKEDISPLGLVSVYISPRQVNDRIIFNFSFTWRTVEAVVGLPYSLYGSVKYAEHLLDEIKKGLGNPQTSILKIGHVSYMAYSLHMFLDPPYARIVRGIINDATK